MTHDYDIRLFLFSCTGYPWQVAPQQSLIPFRLLRQ